MLLTNREASHNISLLYNSTLARRSLWLLLKRRRLRRSQLQRRKPPPRRRSNHECPSGHSDLFLRNPCLDCHANAGYLNRGFLIPRVYQAAVWVVPLPYRLILNRSFGPQPLPYGGTMLLTKVPPLANMTFCETRLSGSAVSST